MSPRFKGGKLVEFKDPWADQDAAPGKNKRKRKSRPLCLTEHDEQALLFRFIDRYMQRHPDLKWAHAIPNGGHRHPAVAVKLKTEGVQRGVPDVEIPAARRGFTGLHIEMKRARGSDWPIEQREWKSGLEYLGRCVVVCKGFEMAKMVLEWYFGDRPWLAVEFAGISEVEPKPYRRADRP